MGKAKARKSQARKSKAKKQRKSKARKTKVKRGGNPFLLSQMTNNITYKAALPPFGANHSFLV